MPGLPISQVARVAGLRPSALRYYESIGLLPAPPRDGGKRRYDERALHRLTLVGRARQLGFSLAEIRGLLLDFPPDAPAGVRWAQLASRKLTEVTALVERLVSMEAELRRIQGCQCRSLDECGRKMYERACAPEPSADGSDRTASRRASATGPASSARRPASRRRAGR